MATMMQKDVDQFICNCFTGDAASCTYACPFHIDLRSFMKKAGRGRVDSCYKDLMNAVSFPEVCCSICPRSCESYCQRSVLGDAPVQVHELELACIRLAKSHTPDVFSMVPKEGAVAVVGAGPAGLAAAFQIAQKGYPVTVWEQTDTFGGCLKSHENYEAFREDFESKFSITKVEFRFHAQITSLEELSDFSAIILATGRDGTDFGLAASRSPISYQTDNPRVFAIGELCGADTCHALAEGNAAANPIEAYLLSGSTEFAHTNWNEAHCSRFVSHTGEEKKEPVSKSGDWFSKDEVKKEAARCMQCNCTDCMNVCEHMRKYKKDPRKLGTEIYQDSQVRPPITAHSATQAVYACNLCGRCSTVCPEETDLPGLFCLSRENRMERGDYPPAFHDYWLRHQDYCSGEAAFTLEGNASGGYAFFPGCQLSAGGPELTEKAYALLKEQFGASLIQACCGAPSYWGGDRRRLDANTAYLKGEWERLGRPKLVTACASCTKMLSKVLPEAETVSLYVLLKDQQPAGSFADMGTVSVFDPCAVATQTEIRQAVRQLASACGAEVSSYDSNGQCCGNGGHMRLADPDLYQEIIRNRASDSEYPFITYCINCREVFRSQGKSARHILEGLLDADAGETPHLDEKARNCMKVKVRLLDKYKNMTFEPTRQVWDDFVLTVGNEVRTAMESKMITDSDVRETIWTAEQNGDGFYNAEENTVLACLVRQALTYWVCYRRETDGSYTVTNAYCHRMHFREKE